jgi:hypothetical protein
MNATFTKLGLLLFAVILWASAQSASAAGKKTINLFLLVLLTSIILLRWANLKPLLIKEG